MPTLTLSTNKTIHYTERGSGTPLVLLHGFPLDSRVWDAQVQSLAECFRVIVPDLPGFGQSTGSEPFTMASLADDVHALLGKLGALPCILGGLSMGGYAAMAFAKKYPNDLRGLLLVDTKSEGDTVEGKKKRDAMIDLVRKSGSKAVADQMFPNMLAKAHQSDAALTAKLRQIMEACPADTIANACAAMRDRTDYDAFLASISVPTLILVGAQDAIIPTALAEKMNSAIARSQMLVIPDAGHMAPLEKPVEVNAAIRGFFDKK